jgi:hypothetical protein
MAALGLVAKMDLLRCDESGKRRAWWKGRDERHPKRYKKLSKGKCP